MTRLLYLFWIILIFVYVYLAYPYENTTLRFLGVIIGEGSYFFYNIRCDCVFCIRISR
ncbi:Uncharacterised protein [Staphylococcus muscae]|uniref:Uncharacterized protein n=1 Tax=Staphylococcus muscae TaxID=1294 RepID=A0A240C5C7_9STAP|nr:Uncharacterised protein [Staphylococcus muscae]